jgi:hypothetical protein
LEDQGRKKVDAHVGRPPVAGICQKRHQNSVRVSRSTTVRSRSPTAARSGDKGTTPKISRADLSDRALGSHSGNSAGPMGRLPSWKRRLGECAAARRKTSMIRPVTPSVNSKMYLRKRLSRVLGILRIGGNARYPAMKRRNSSESVQTGSYICSKRLAIWGSNRITWSASCVPAATIELSCNMSAPTCLPSSAYGPSFPV